MNRSQLINILAQKTGLNKKDVKRTIDEMQKLIVQEVTEGQIKNKKRLTFTSKSFFIYSAIVGVRRFELPTTRPPGPHFFRYVKK